MTAGTIRRVSGLYLPTARQAFLETAMIRSRSALCLSSGSHTGCIPSPVEALVATSTATLLPCFCRRLLTTAVGQRASHRLRPAASPAARFSSSQRFIRRNKSTTAIDFTQSSSTPTSIGSLSSDALAGPAGSVVLPVPPPTPQALRTLFVASAIPMVGFGFMDNLVLIQAGQFIDSTLGVSLGLATMTAAAAGQVVSDVSGVIMGGSLERVLLQLNLIATPDLSSAQRRLSVCRNVSMAGAVCGVIVGCALGATTLLLVDLEKRNRIERAQQLQVIVGDMIALQEGDDASSDDEEGGSLQTESCCIYVSNADDFQVDNDPRHRGDRIGLKHLSPDADPPTPPMVRESAARNTLMLSPDRSVLYLPVREDDQVLAVLELRKRQPPTALSSPGQVEEEGGSESRQVDLQRVVGFSEADVRTAKVVARHLGIFMNRLCE